MTDGRGSNGSQHEKDSGISRTTDSEGEFVNGIGTSLTPSPPLPANPPPSKPPPKSASRFSQESFTTSTTIVGSGNEVSSPATEFHRTAPSSAVTTPSEAPRLYRSESEGSLARELAHLHREMQNIQLECDRLVERYAKQEQRVRLQVEKANQWMSNLDGVQYGAGADIKPMPSQKPPAVVQRPREETSSAYNTGDSCRSTPLHNNINYYTRFKIANDGIAKETTPPKAPPPPPQSLLKKSPVVTFSPQLPVRKSPYETNSYLRVKKSEKASGTSPPAMRQPPQQQPFPFTVGDIMYTDANNLQYTMQLQQRLLRQAMLDQAKQLKSDEHWGQGPVSSLKLYSNMLSGGESSENVEWKVKEIFISKIYLFE